MSALSNLIHTAVADVEAFIADVERLFGHKDAKAAAAVQKLKTTASAIAAATPTVTSAGSTGQSAEPSIPTQANPQP